MTSQDLRIGIGIDYVPDLSGRHVPDLSLTDGRLSAVITVRPGEGSRTAMVTFTKVREDGGADLVGVIHIPAPEADASMPEYFEALWPSWVALFGDVRGSIHLKGVQREPSQGEIAAHAATHLAVLAESQPESTSESSVLISTARQWKLLAEFGSSRPAEVIAALTHTKARTINARLTQARKKGLLEPAKRSSSLKSPGSM